MSKLEELKKELTEAEAELNDTKDTIKEYDKKITDLSYTKACMEEKLRLVNEKIDALKDQIECLSAKPRVFKCTNEINPYGATQGTYGICHNGCFLYKTSNHLENRNICTDVCPWSKDNDRCPSGFEEVTDLFEGLKNGKVIFVVTKEKTREFLYILRRLDGVHYNKDCITFDADNLFYKDPYNEESFIISRVFTSIFFDMKSEMTLVMF